MRRELEFVASALACAVLSVGCSGGSGDGDDAGERPPNCAFEVEVSGAFSYDQPYEEIGCVYSANFDTGVGMAFVRFDEEELGGVTLQIDEIRIDEVGEFPATVTVNRDGGRRYEFDDCTVQVSTHEPDPDGTSSLGLPYRIVGTGSCTPPGEEVSDPSETVTISDFRFSAPTAWNE